MIPKVNLTLILPAYNEIATIGSTIASAQKYFAERQITYQIIVSADGTDGTREMVSQLAIKEPRLTVTGSRNRKGKGHGIRQAVRLAHGRIGRSIGGT